MADQPPRKLTIKLRPVGAKPAARAVSAPATSAAPTPPPATPVAEPVAPTASAPEIKLPATEAAKRHTTRISLEAIEGAGEATPAVAQEAKSKTARVEVPETGTEEEVIKLKPISRTAEAVPAEQQTQAAKSKTARIALDSVLSGIQTNAPLGNTTQKTIKLKRSTPTATHATTSKPMQSVEPGTVDTEEKTIKLTKRPAGLALKKPAAPDPVEPEMEELEPLEALDDLSTLDVKEPIVAESTGAKVFTIASIVAAIASIIVIAVTCFFIQKHAASPDGSTANGNTLHSLPFEQL